MAKNDALIQSQVATLKNPKNQMGQLATELRNWPQGVLPSDTENPRNQGKEHCKAITLRSGTQLPGVVNDAITDEDNSNLTYRKNSDPSVE